MNQIIINKDKLNTKEIILLKDDTIVERYREIENQNRIEGNIYIGIIKDILPGMQAAFVDIGEEKNAFIHLKDLLPKIDETKDTVQNNISISKLVKQNEKILVQVKRDKTNKKGAKISTHINLTSRFVVLMPQTNIITCSQKIEDEDIKAKLIKLAKENLPKEFGLILRTSAKDANTKDIVDDIKNVIKKWNNIKTNFNKTTCTPKLLYKSDNIIKKIIIDTIDLNLNQIIVNNKEIYEQIKQILEQIKIDNIEIIYKDEDLLDKHFITVQLEEIEKRKIWLKCGGFITIDKTEALTAIDVNTGKYIGKENLEKTVFLVNKEASIEIARQLKLRDIGGIIIIDYIDMLNEQDKNSIMDILSNELKKDRSKTQIIDFTKLNLLELTRKHMYSSDNMN